MPGSGFQRVMTAASHCLIRTATLTDLPAVLRVERDCYANPWSEEQFRLELEKPFSSVELLLVDGELAGFLCYWLLQGELEILNLATAPEYRRRGLASRLLRHVLELAEGQGMGKAFLEVRAGNRSALALYESFGFLQSYRRRGYYPDGEDALVMEKTNFKKSG